MFKMYYFTFPILLQVYNFIPSISAVTGIFPQCYLWRITIALHCTPRFIMGSMYSNLYHQHMKSVTSTSFSSYNFLVKLTYWLHFTENLSLIGVTYISNKDNYRMYLLNLTSVVASLSSRWGLIILYIYFILQLYTRSYLLYSCSAQWRICYQAWF